MVEMFARMVTGIRRFLVKNPHMIRSGRRIRQAYHTRGQKGTEFSAEAVQAAQPAPPLGHKHRTKWKPTTRSFGPIGILIGHIYMLGASLDEDFDIVRYNEAPISLTT